MIGTDRDMLLGAAAVAAAAIVYALGAVLSRPLMARYSNIYLSAFTMTFGGGLLLAAALATGPGLGRVLTTPWGWPAFGAWLFLVLFVSLLGYPIYIHLLRVWGSSRSGSFAFLSSAIAVVPSSPRSKPAFNWLFARSTSAEVGPTLIRVHSLNVKCMRSSRFIKFSDTR